MKEFLISKQEKVTEIIRNNQQELKVNFKVFCKCSKYSDSGNLTSEIKSFKTKNEVILSTTNLVDMHTNCVDKMLSESSEFTEKESGWVLEEILYLEVRTNKYNPMRGSSYLDLPPFIKAKKAVINVKNNDQQCFKWAVLSALFPASDHVDRVSKYEEFSDTLNFNGIQFPVTLKDIPKFEKLNDISVNVYGYKTDYKIYPLYVSTEENDTHIDLLFIKHKNNTHFCWIKNLSKLVSKQQTNRNGQYFICRCCLLLYQTETAL